MALSLDDNVTKKAAYSQYSSAASLKIYFESIPSRMKFIGTFSLVLLSSITTQLACDAAPVNLNVKSGFLSRILGNSSSRPKPSTSPTSPSVSSTATLSEQRSKRKVSLDLSGKYHCLVAGPSLPTGNTEGPSEPVPLFYSGTISKGWSPPSLVCSVGYNFSQAWYGATRLLTNLSWSYRNKESTAHSPLTVHIQGEKDLLNKDDYAAQVGLSLASSSPDTSPLSLQLRWEEPQACKQVVMAAPLHKRIGVVWKSIFPTHQQQDSFTFFSSRLSPLNKEDWWIPNLKINTNGRLTSDNQVSFPLSRRRDVGIRLVFSRQLGWSAFGEIMDDHLGTLVKLQVTAANVVGGASLSSATVTSVLEQPLDSTQLTLSHEQVYNRT